jgi:predicted nucleotidyltransferase
VVDRAKVMEAAELLRNHAPQGSQIILFGSRARGDFREDSDADFLVVEPSLRNRRAEMVRLREVVRPTRVPVDIVVVGRGTFEQWRDTPNTVIYEAAREGIVL